MEDPQDKDNIAGRLSKVKWQWVWSYLSEEPITDGENDFLSEDHDSASVV